MSLPPRGWGYTGAPQPPKRDRDGFAVAFVAFWIVALAFSLAIWGVTIWAVIELVQWITTK